MKKRQVACLAIALLLISQAIILVSAMDVTPKIVPLNLWNKFQYMFKGEQFSIIGETRGPLDCSTTHNSAGTTLVAKGQSYTHSAEEFCGSGKSGLFDVYLNGYSLPWREYSGAVSFFCDTLNGCNVELYCCNYAPCYNDADCSWKGSGATCKTGSCVAITSGSQSGGYWCSAEGKSELTSSIPIPYYSSNFKYCSSSTQTSKTCYYYPGTGSTCSSKTYTDATTCPTSINYKTAYSDKSVCESNIPGASCVPNCAGKTCGDNGCGGSCGSCSDSQSCVNNQCLSSDTSCRSPSSWVSKATECCGLLSVGCSDKRCVSNAAECGSCGCQGTECLKDADCCQGNTCGMNGVYQKQSCVNGQCQQACQEGYTQCPNDNRCVADINTDCQDLPNTNTDDSPIVGIQILNFRITDIDNGVLPEKITPGQTIKVKFTVRNTEANLLDSRLVETGIIPANLATKRGINKPDGIFALLGPYGGMSIDSCCANQVNFAFNKGRINNPLPLQQSATTDYEFEVNVPYEGIKDLCGSENYFDNSSQYVVYAMVKNGCSKDGFNHAVFSAKSIELNFNATSSGGKACDGDGDCQPGERCLLNENSGYFGLFKSKTCQGNDAVQNKTLIDFKKISLTKEIIRTATTEDLLASACLKSSECIYFDENYTTACLTIDSLRKEGVLSESTTKSFFDKAKTITGGSVIGATAGVVGCSVLWGGVGTIIGGPAGGAASVISLLANPATLGSCAAVGGVLGGTGTAVAVNLKQDDNLVKKLRASDSSSVGICTAEEKNTFDIGSFLKKIGESISITGNPTWDGLIVIVGGLFILMIFFNMMNKK